MKNLKSRLAATTLALLVVVAFVAPATAQTREEFCTTAADLTMALGGLRDGGISPDAVYTHLVSVLGWPTESAHKAVYSVWVIGENLSPRDLGYGVWTSCMGEAS